MKQIHLYTLVFPLGWWFLMIIDFGHMHKYERRLKKTASSPFCLWDKGEAHMIKGGVLYVCGYVFCPRLRQTTWTIILMPMLCSTKMSMLTDSCWKNMVLSTGIKFFKYRVGQVQDTRHASFFLLFVISLRYINMTHFTHISTHMYKYTYIHFIY